MSSQTSKQLVKPTTAELQDVTVINSNMDRINDYGMGAFVCTSTTRPTGSNLWAGLIIFETDTKFYRSYDGSAWSASLNTPTYTGANRPSSGLIAGDRITDGANTRLWDGAGWRNTDVLFATVSPTDAISSWSVANATWVGLSYMDTLATNDSWNFALTAITPTGSNVSSGLILQEAGFYKCSVFSSAGSAVASGPIAIKTIACDPSGTIIADQLCYADKMANTQANGLVTVGGYRYLPAGTRIVTQVYQSSGAAVAWPAGLIGTGAQAVLTVEKGI